MSAALVKDIWIEADQWTASESDFFDDNADVIVTLANGEKWIATFFTYKNILSIAEKNKTTSECLAGAYFWATDMILVEELSRGKIESVVADLINQNEFEHAFRGMRNLYE